jgi:ribosomal protein S18 acetylase RimI-like enzyme
MLLVKESFQGKGIGKLLLKYFEDDLTSKYNKVFLMVADQNEKAKAIYLKSGYKQVGVLEDFYIDGITEILMRKDK